MTTSSRHNLTRVAGVALGVVAMSLVASTLVVAQPAIIDLGDLQPGARAAGSSSSGGFTDADAGVVFAAETDPTGRELFITDGTAAGTTLLADLAVGEESSRPEELTAYDGWVYFRADGDAATQLYRTDGRTVEPILGGDTPLQDPSHFFGHDGWVWFAADTGGIAVLWRTNGTTTELVADDVSNVRYFTVFQDTLYFHAFDPDVTTQLWRLSGQDVAPVGSGLGDVGGALADRRDQLKVWDERLVVSNDRLWFAADSGSGQEIHAWDGNEVTTIALQPDDAASVDWITAAAGWTWFTADGGDGRQLWRSNGDQVQRVDDLATADPQPAELTAVDDGLIFHADTGSGREVYAATADGSVTQLTDLVPGEEGASAEWLTPTPDGIYFAAQNQFDDVNGLWLIVPDQSTVTRIEGPRILSGLTATDLGLLFAGSDDAIGNEPRLVMFVDGGPGPNSSPSGTPTPSPEPTPQPTSTPDPTPAPDPSTGVQRIAGPDRLATAVAVSQQAFPEPVTTVFLATGADFPDALAGGPAAAAADGPLLLTDRDALRQDVLDELVRLSPETIVLLGGEAVLGPEIEAAVAQTGAVVVRRAGAGRIQTAVEISRATFDPGVDVVHLATAGGFADALAAGARAGALSGPVLLVGESLDPAVASELRRLEPDRIVVAGGVAAVSEAVATAAGQAAGAPVDRAAGASRYETAVALASDLTRADQVVVATGASFPDALAGVVPAALDGSPLLLVDPGGVPAAVQTELDRLGTTQILLLGGEAVIDETIADELRQLLQR